MTVKNSNNIRSSFFSKKNVNPWYYNSKEYFENSHSGYLHEWEDELHYSKWYGIFKYYKHYKQSNRVTNEKLFAYCKVAYDGEAATVHLIFGHENNLKEGIMTHLLTSIVKECFENKNIKYLIYSTWSPPLNTWKARHLFKRQQIRYIL